MKKEKSIQTEKYEIVYWFWSVYWLNRNHYTNIFFGFFLKNFDFFLIVFLAMRLDLLCLALLIGAALAAKKPNIVFVLVSHFKSLLSHNPFCFVL